jgi:membrane-associated protein
MWSLGVTLAGYALGSSIPNIDRYLLPVIALIVVVSLLPLAAEALRSRRAARETR